MSCLGNLICNPPKDKLSGVSLRMTEELLIFKFFRLLLLFMFCSVDDWFCVDEFCNTS